MSLSDNARVIREKQVMHAIRAKLKRLEADTSHMLRGLNARDPIDLRGVVDDLAATMRIAEEYIAERARDNRQKMLDAIPKHPDGHKPTGGHRSVNGVAFWAYSGPNGRSIWRSENGRVIIESPAAFAGAPCWYVAIDGEFVRSDDNDDRARRFKSFEGAASMGVRRMATTEARA